jgi:hypothetical protein
MSSTSLTAVERKAALLDACQEQDWIEQEVKEVEERRREEERAQEKELLKELEELERLEEEERKEKEVAEWRAKRRGSRNVRQRNGRLRKRLGWRRRPYRGLP